METPDRREHHHKKSRKHRCFVSFFTEAAVCTSWFSRQLVFLVWASYLPFIGNDPRHYQGRTWHHRIGVLRFGQRGREDMAIVGMCMVVSGLTARSSLRVPESSL